MTSDPFKDSITDQLLSDTRSGIYSDLSGRRFFRQRRVIFETIRIHEDEMHGSGWMGFEELPYPEWENFPDTSRIRDFALAASERYIAFWYRVFDVAVARSLSGQRREIFQKPFFVPSILFDIGITEDPAHASVPPALHEKIMNEYRKSLGFQARYRIFYISQYLRDLTADINQRLSPLRGLWESRELRSNLLGELNDTRREMVTPLLIRVRGETLRDILADTVMRTTLSHIDRLHSTGKIRTIRSDEMRKLIYKRGQGDLNRLQKREIDLIITLRDEIALPEPIALLHRAMFLPEELYDRARFAASLLSSAYRMRLRLTRMKYMHIRYGTEFRGETLMHAMQNRERLASERIERLNPAGDLSGILEIYASIAVLSDTISSTEGAGLEGEISRFFKEISAGKAAHSDSARDRSLRYSQRFYETLKMIARNDDAILSHYNGFLQTPFRSLPESESETFRIPSDSRYASGERLEFPEGVDPGNPFTERDCVEAARRLILKRLRPLRMTSSGYSVIPGERHGALTLNPVMRLWKDKPYPGRREDPRLIGLEINTRETVECLLRLALLVDPPLAERSIRRGRIVAIGRRREDLNSLTIFLLPGSCAPVRELDRRNFPEFRGRVIGESRGPVELGVAPTEDSVLTGAWYQKRNHTLYYPVGGDNGMLLRQIWNSARISGPPAFFFALGQFVHDCMEDSLIYHFEGESTFRHCVEDYYRLEERVRKNRGDRTGRRRTDNSRPAVRFMFAVNYSRLMLELLSGSSQGDFRHPMTEEWMHRRLGIPLLGKSDRSGLRGIRARALEIIRELSGVTADS